MAQYKALDETTLLLNQNMEQDDVENEMRYLVELRSRDSLEIYNKEQKIVILERELARLLKFEESQVPFASISEEAKVLHGDLIQLRYAPTLISNFEKIDTLVVFETIICKFGRAPRTTRRAASPSIHSGVARR